MFERRSAWPNSSPPLVTRGYRGVLPFIHFIKPSNI